MPSAINPAFPVTGNPTTQSVRQNFQAAKTEIEALQASEIVDVGIDGKLYGRKDQAWAEVQVTAAGVPEANIDGKLYGRKDAAWSEINFTGGGLFVFQIDNGGNLWVKGEQAEAQKFSINTTGDLIYTIP